VKPWHSSTPADPLPPSYGCASGCTDVATGVTGLRRRKRPLIKLLVGGVAGVTSESWHVCAGR
jgi:hypothetical protein